MDKLDAFGSHQIHAPADYLFLQFHIGNAVLKQTADSISAFKHGHPMTGFIELVGASQTGRTRPHNGHPLSRANNRRRGNNPAFFKPLFDNGLFNGFDGNGRFVDAQRAGTPHTEQDTPAR